MERLPDVRAHQGELTDAGPRPAAEVERARPLPGAALQAAAAAGAGAVAGAVVIAGLRGGRRSRGTLKVGRGRKARKLSVLGTRTFLVDVTFVERR